MTKWSFKVGQVIGIILGVVIGSAAVNYAFGSRPQRPQQQQIYNYSSQPPVGVI